MNAATSSLFEALTLSGRMVRSVAYAAAGIICLTLAYGGRFLFRHFVIRPYKSYIKYLPGPKPKGAFISDCGLICEAATCKEYNERFMHKYGLNVRIQGVGYMDQRLVTYDPVTISYILGPASDRFLKPVQMRRLIAKLTGGDLNLKGINVVEGPYHHRLRKIIAPAFSASAVRGHAPVFIRKASEMCDHWRSILSEPTAPALPGVETDTKGNTLLDIHNWIGRLAFDVIGLAAFGYSFDSLRDESNEVFGAYMRLHNATCAGPDLRTNICLAWPQLEPFLRNKSERVIAESAHIVRETSKVVLKEMQGINPEGVGRSILSLLLRSNANAAPEDRLTDEELLTQIDSFMFAGSDTTGLSTTWALYEIARNPEVQQALRTELRPLDLHKHVSERKFANDSGIDVDMGTPDHAALFASIESLPLLDRVLRESLRLHPSVPSTLRVAEEDDIIPFSPDSPPGMSDGSISLAVVTGLGVDGVERTGIRIRKGDYIHIPFEATNSIRDVWGEDGHKFNPDRWLDLPAAAKKTPGVVPSLSTFSVGPHSCPAFQFAMAEMKVTIAHVVSAFNLEETQIILPVSRMMKRPYVENQWYKGYRLPLRVLAL